MTDAELKQVRDLVRCAVRALAMQKALYWDMPRTVAEFDALTEPMMNGIFASVDEAPSESELPF